jgi:hypothetical protein
VTLQIVCPAALHVQIQTLIGLQLIDQRVLFDQGELKGSLVVGAGTG